MRKNFILGIVFILILSIILVRDFNYQTIQAKLPIGNNTTPYEDSTEELYRDVIITMLLPYIDAEVEKYYGKPYLVAPYSTFVKSVTRQPSKQWTFGIKLEVTPYWGPHNTVGVDEITFGIAPSKVEVIEFKHLKSYDLPELLR
jgi:hypothetical protein